jgi:hypothetical protein
MANQPAPEISKLAYFVGKWITEGTIFPGPWGAGGKFGWTETTEWMTGNFFIVGHWDFQMPAELGGDGKELFVIGYDTSQNVYTFDAFSSQGLHQISKGTLNGDTWTWTSQAVHDGKPTKQRFTMKILSPTRYTLKFEHSRDGANWIPFMEGTANRQST